MYTIIFNINNGKPPFVVEILEGGVPLVYAGALGQWTIQVPDCGTYNIRITDAENCIDEFEAICECPPTTTTTTVIPTTTTTTHEPVTTTTTEIEEFPCNFPVNIYTTQYHTQYSFDITADTGVISLDFLVYNIP